MGWYAGGSWLAFGILTALYYRQRTGEGQMVDVAPTFAALLGANIPASAQGRVLEEMLTLPPQVSAVIPDATREQQSRLLTAYAASFAPGEKVDIPQSPQVADYQAVITSIRDRKIFAGRVWRSAVAALFLASVVSLLWRQRKQGAGAWLLTGLITALLFNFRYALLDGKVYSLSSIIGVTDLIVYVGVTSAVSFLLAVLSGQERPTWRRADSSSCRPQMPTGKPTPRSCSRSTTGWSVRSRRRR